MRSFQRFRLWTRQLVLGVLTVAAANVDADCRCLWQGPFVRSQQQADVVLEGEVLEQRGNAFDVAVNRVLRGELYPETVRIWGHYAETPPGVCRAPAAAFEPGSRWVLALERIDAVPAGGFNPATPNISFGRKGDYALSRCGANWLEIHDGLVRGNLANGARWQYEDEEMEPVRPELLANWLQGDVKTETLIEAAKPNPEARRLREATRRFLRQQNPPFADGEP